MKKLIFLLIPVLALLTACQTGIEQIIPSFRPAAPVFYASIEEDRPADPETKVYADGQMRVLWNADDRISIFNKQDANLEYCFEGEDGDNAGTFKIVGSSVAGNVIPHIYSVYPYAEGTTINAEGTLYMMLPAVQPYKTKSFGIGANTMVSVTDDTKLQFRNLGGYLSLKLYGDGVEVKSIRLKGNHGEKIAGVATVTAAVDGVPVAAMSDEATETITLDCGKGVALKASEADYTEFWLVVPPTAFQEGFTITVTDIRGGVYSKSTTKDLTISRNKLSRMSPIQVIPDYTNANAAIEDDNFRAYCVAEFDKSGDGIIQMEEALLVTKIDVCTDNIESLEGIAFFANLEDLSCKGSESLLAPSNSQEAPAVYGGKLKNLDLSHNKKLVRVDCSGNKIETLDVSQNTELESLTCTNNPITTVNLAEDQVIPTVEIPEEAEVVYDWVAPVQGDNEIWYTTIDGKIVEPYNAEAFGGATIVSNTYENGMGKLVFDGVLSVIGTNAFSDFGPSPTLRSVTFPSTLTTIGACAFSYNRNLKTIHLNEGLLKIDSEAFEDCASLDSVYIPSTITQVSGSAFLECRNLRLFTGAYASPDGRFIIKDGVACGFAPKDLTEVSIPEGVTAISAMLFQWCYYLTEVTLPSTLKEIGNHAFYDCSSLMQMDIPASVQTIGSGVFSGCGRLSAFSGKFATEDGRFLINGTTLVGFAPYGMTDVVIPSGVEIIADQVMASIGITTCVLPSSITAIGKYAFNGCTELTAVTVLALDVPTGYIGMFNETNNCPIYVPAESLEDYKAARYWKDYADRIKAIPEEQPNDEIWYTSTDGKIVEPASTERFGANIVSNTYENGKGIIKFDGPVTMIGDKDENTLDYAPFWGCRTLKTISLPSSVENLGLGCFMRCSNLASFSGKFASADHRCLIMDKILVAFAPAGLTSYTVEEGVETIGLCAFYYSPLTEVVLPDGLKIIEQSAFEYCTNLTRITLPASLEGIRPYAFARTSLNSVHIPDNVGYIGPGAFADCDNLASFSGKIASSDGRCLILNDEMVAFAPLGLTRYVVPDGVRYMGIGTVSHCGGLHTIVLPESISVLASQAIYYCQNLDSIVVLATTPPKVNDRSFQETNNCPIYVPATSEEAYKTAESWSTYVDRIRPLVEGQPNDEIWYTSTDGAIVTPKNSNVFGAGIVSNTYENGKGVIKFDGDVTSIGGAAFDNCTTLKTIDLPSTATTLGNASFQSCSNLESVTLPEGITTLPIATFNICRKLTSILLPSSLTTIKEGAFSDSGITSITIPANVTTIGPSVFLGCSHLAKFEGRYATEDGRCLIMDNTLRAFAPSGLTSYSIPANVTKIADAFFYCSKLTSISLPAGLKEIDDYAFTYCSGLTSISLPSGLERIGKCAFAHCSGLTEIILPDSVQNIEPEVFAYCTKLKSFSGAFASEDHCCLIKDNTLLAFAQNQLKYYFVPEGTTRIERNVFYQIDNLAYLILPHSLTEMSGQAIVRCPSLHTIIMKGMTPPTCNGVNMIVSNIDFSIITPEPAVDVYKSATAWSGYADRIFANPVNTPELVDLGLPSGTKWANCNLGAYFPEDSGIYYSWGETDPKLNYSWSSYKWGLPSYETSKYNSTDNITVLEAEDDVVTVKLGGNWRLPTHDEQVELRNNCTWTWMSVLGTKGYQIVGPNGNSIFLPVTGGYFNTSFDNADQGKYWSSSVDTHVGFSQLFSLEEGLPYSHAGYAAMRNFGYCVRPVSK